MSNHQRFFYTTKLIYFIMISRRVAAVLVFTVVLALGFLGLALKVNPFFTLLAVLVGAIVAAIMFFEAGRK
jgi:hypothetical protein